MDEMKLVERVFAEAKADPGVAAAGRARLLQMAGGEESVAETRRPARTRLLASPRSRWMLGAGLLPVAAAGVAAVTLAGHGSAPVSPSSDGQARRVLLVAATRTESAPATGRYFRFRTERGGLSLVGSKDHPYKVVGKTVQDVWYPVASGTTGLFSFQQLGARPATPADAAAWRAAGSPDPVRVPCDEHVVYGGNKESQTTDRCARIPMRPRPASSAPLEPGPGMFGQPPVGLDLAKLSDNPATLRRQLLAWTRSGGLNGPVEGDSAQLWTAALYIIASPIGPVRPTLRAATYRVLAALPDVRSLGEVTDQKGRRGQALARTAKSSEGVAPGTDRLVIDPRTGAPLESSNTGNASQGYMSVLDFGYTDATPPTAGN
ncbi:CU044_5270 family protein [Spirillospora sp. NPDC052269]